MKMNKQTNKPKHKHKYATTTITTESINIFGSLGEMMCCRYGVAGKTFAKVDIIG